MRIAISNIAWDISEDLSVAKLLQQNKIDAIDIAPSKYFPILSTATDQQIDNLKSWWAYYGIEITGMQSLMFGTVGLNLFGETLIQEKMFDHLSHICRIGGQLNAKRLVFGSPKNRDCSSVKKTIVNKIAISFFRKLGDIAHKNNVFICLEPNPECYGANFMTSSFTTAEIVSEIDHPNIKMQLDTGTLTLNKENISDLLEKYSSLIGHIHISEPHLKTVGDWNNEANEDPTVKHSNMSKVIHKYLPHHLVSIEMLIDHKEDQKLCINRALKFVQSNYSTITNL